MNKAQQDRIEAAIRADDKVLIRWLTKKLRDSDVARDVAQTVYMRVWAFSETETVENPRALIFKTASNLALNELKRRNRFDRRHVAALDNEENDPLENVAALTPSPETQTAMREDVALTLEAIRQLPERPRRAFMMNRFDGLSYREIAAAMNVSESSIEKYMIEALKILREKLRTDTGAKVVAFPRSSTKKMGSKT